MCTTEYRDKHSDAGMLSVAPTSSLSKPILILRCSTVRPSVCICFALLCKRMARCSASLRNTVRTPQCTGYHRAGEGSGGGLHPSGLRIPEREQHLRTPVWGRGHHLHWSTPRDYCGQYPAGAATHFHNCSAPLDRGFWWWSVRLSTHCLGSITGQTKAVVNNSLMQ